MSNHADDERNSTMSDLAQDNNVMHRALYEVVEIYAGLEGFRTDTPIEKYLELRLREAYLVASEALKRVG